MNLSSRLIYLLRGLAPYMILGLLVAAVSNITLFSYMQNNIYQTKYFDKHWIRRVQDLTWLGPYFRISSMIGNTPVILLITVPMMRHLYARNNFHTSMTFAILLSSSFIVSFTLKHMFNRERPVNDGFGEHNLTTSFPSGHSIAVPFIFFLVQWFLIKKYSKKALLLVPVLLWQTFFTVISRVYLSTHYPTDIVGGLLASACFLSVFYLGLKRNKEFFENEKYE
ncbi:undecaprenyl-diphosphatase [Acrasis kona]|uniref:Undecaprenyl-diphosphatase n=1 Tax=Acrasis kona TaxID=1008807 RepID=A0AAW2ZHC7_9EUKA